MWCRLARGVFTWRCEKPRKENESKPTKVGGARGQSQTRMLLPKTALCQIHYRSDWPIVASVAVQSGNVVDTEPNYLGFS